MTELLSKLLSDGFNLVELIHSSKFGEGSHYYLGKKLTEKLKNKKIYILQKDDLIILVGD